MPFNPSIVTINNVSGFDYLVSLRLIIAHARDLNETCTIATTDSEYHVWTRNWNRDGKKHIVFKQVEDTTVFFLVNQDFTAVEMVKLQKPEKANNAKHATLQNAIFYQDRSETAPFFAQYCMRGVDMRIYRKGDKIIMTYNGYLKDYMHKYDEYGRFVPAILPDQGHQNSLYCSENQPLMGDQEMHMMITIATLDATSKTLQCSACDYLCTNCSGSMEKNWAVVYHPAKNRYYLSHQISEKNHHVYFALPHAFMEGTSFVRPDCKYLVSKSDVTNRLSRMASVVGRDVMFSLSTPYITFGEMAIAVGHVKVNMHTMGSFPPQYQPLVGDLKSIVEGLGVDHLSHKKLYYAMYFYEIDLKNMEITRMSHLFMPWSGHTYSLYFASGLTSSKVHGHYILSYGVGDLQCEFMEVTYTSIAQALHDGPTAPDLSDLRCKRWTLTGGSPTLIPRASLQIKNTKLPPRIDERLRSQHTPMNEDPPSGGGLQRVRVMGRVRAVKYVPIVRYQGKWVELKKLQAMEKQQRGCEPAKACPSRRKHASAASPSQKSQKPKKTSKK